jgi:phage terminase large subunit-like protein
VATPRARQSSRISSRVEPKGWPPRHLTAVPKAAVDAGDGDRVLTFLREAGRITKDSVAGRSGEPLNPRPWQEQLVRQTFARDPKTGRRRARTAMWGMARKNGKTGLIAPIALYGLMAEGDGAEVYSCAADRDQAKLVFQAAKRTVEMVPVLSKHLKLYRDVIEYPAAGSIYRALSSEAYTKEGLSPTLVLADELHAWPNRELYDVMALAMGARVDPLMLIVTTPGVRTDSTGVDSIAYTLYQYGTRVASGEVVDPSFFMAWWQAETGCALDDPKAWAEANPGLGDILDRDELAGQARKAMAGGMTEPEFRIKRLSQWVNSARAALPSGAFERLGTGGKLDPKEPQVLFFDGSFYPDCTGSVACSLDGRLETLECWERPVGEVGWKVPIGEVDLRMREIAEARNVLEIGCDPFRWAEQIENWEAAGLPVLAYPTSSPSRMVPAISEGTLRHDNDPRLVRHVSNMTIKTDRLGPRPVKEHRGSPRSIDLGICAVGAYDRATWHASRPPAPPTASGRVSFIDFEED